MGAVMQREHPGADWAARGDQSSAQVAGCTPAGGLGDRAVAVVSFSNCEARAVMHRRPRTVQHRRTRYPTTGVAVGLSPLRSVVSQGDTLGQRLQRRTAASSRGMPPERGAAAHFAVADCGSDLPSMAAHEKGVIHQRDLKPDRHHVPSPDRLPSAPDPEAPGQIRGQTRYRWVRHRPGRDRLSTLPFAALIAKGRHRN